MSDWRSTGDGPDWRDAGSAEFMRKDGTIVRGHLKIDELWTGTEEIPSPSVTLDDGTEASFHDFEGWRAVGAS